MKILSQTSTALLGLLAGGSLLIAIGLVPYWQSLNPEDFTRVFSDSMPTLGGTMAVLTILGTVSIIIAAAIATWRKLPNKSWLLASAVNILVMISTLPFYFGSANPLLVSGTLSADATLAELTTWGQVHWFRTVVGIIGFFCAVRAA